MQSNERVIKDMCKAKMVKALALFHWLKKHYSHSVIYNYSAKKIASECGLSEKTVRKYVNYLLGYSYHTSRFTDKCPKKPVAELKDGHLRLFKIQPPKHLCTIKFSQNATIKDIEALLFGKVLHDYHDRQLYNIVEKKEYKRIIENPKGLKEVKKRKRILKRTSTLVNGEYKIVTPSICELKMAYPGMTHETNLSRGKLSNVLKSLQEKGKIKSTPQFEFLGLTGKGEYLRNKDLYDQDYGNTWWFKGGVYSRRNNLIEFLDYPNVQTIEYSSKFTAL